MDNQHDVIDKHGCSDPFMKMLLEVSEERNDLVSALLVYFGRNHTRQCTFMDFYDSYLNTLILQAPLDVFTSELVCLLSDKAYVRDSILIRVHLDLDKFLQVVEDLSKLGYWISSCIISNAVDYHFFQRTSDVAINRSQSTNLVKLLRLIHDLD